MKIPNSKIRLTLAGFTGLFLLSLLSVPFVRSQELKKVRMGYPAFSLTFLTFFVAKDAGIFKKHGLDVDLVQLAGAVQTSALVSGEIDYLTGITGPLVAAAREEGYMQKRAPGEKSRRPFHGYYFRIIKRQGSHAPGGKFDYIINNNMVAGHALVAFPARWGVSGIMTFIVNQRGRVYQKNLGPKTAEIARKMKEYNPDLTWKLVEQ